MSNLAIRSFAAGEIAPSLYARTDQARYEVGLRTCRNWLVMRQGGATRRPGTEYLTGVKTHTKKVRLIPFIFNVRQTFVLEFGEGYVRFIQRGAQVIDTGTTPLEIASPYLEADLPDLQYTQSADVITIVHPSYPPYELERHSNTNWTLTAITFGSATAIPAITIIGGGDIANARDTNYVITAVADSGEESLASAVATAVGPPTALFAVVFSGTIDTAYSTFNVYRQDGDSGVFGFIGSSIVSSAGVVVYSDFGTVPDNTLQPPIEKVLFASEDNYPSVVAYYQQRLLFANSNTNPDTIWASRTGYYHNFNVSAIVQDDDAITFRMVAGQVNAVRHLLDLSRLVVGTEGGASIIEGDGNGTLTPIAVNPRAVSYGGMGPLKPVTSGANFLYAQALGSSIRELQSATTAYGGVSFAGGDVTIFSSHLVDGFSITDWAFQEEPVHIVWAVRSDGVLLGLTYIPEQQVLAWHRHDTDGFVENVCVVPEGRAHFLYVVVRRLINGTYKRYIERMATSNVTPVFATPDEAAQGGVVTPPPPPPPPGSSPSSVLPPTSATTTDVLPTSATANWIAGNLLAPTEVSYRVQGGSDDSWVTTTIAGGIQSYLISGLTASTAYEWRVRHSLSGAFSAYLGPSSATQFTTALDAFTLITPFSAPTITNTVSSSGFTDITISWPASTQSADSEIQIAGPDASLPDEADYESLGSFVFGVTSAVQRIEHGGTYWLRVRYAKTGFTDSGFAGPSEWNVTVVDEV